MTPLPSANTGAAPDDIFVGCAGWSIPKEHADRFAPAEGNDGGGTHLERYARRLNAVEINSSFYRPHRPATYARWAASVPEHFRFSVKLPRQITHIQKLREPEETLTSFLGEIAALGGKLGPILVQLPPSLAFEEQVVSAFFEAMRSRFDGLVVCEPRHATWFQTEAETVLNQFRIARVAADPAVLGPEAARPGGWDGVVYYRLHGSPRVYYSDYSEEYREAMAKTLTQATGEPTESVPGAVHPRQPVWCIFDNTALGAAAGNALDVFDRVRS
jgi:uncharacterized protein YecE (DUF72 family)